MKKFKHIDDIEQWLEPMEYEEFWYVIKDYYLVLPSRDGCDQQIWDGEVEQELVLEGLKYMARIELTKRHDLHWKMPTPWLKVVK